MNISRTSWIQVVFAVVALGSLGALAWLFYRTPRTVQSSPEVQALKLGESSPAEATTPKTILVSDSVVQPILGSEPPTREPDARGTPTEQEHFAKKYEGLSRLELEVALGGLSPLRRELQTSIVRDRIAAGQFTRIYPEGDVNLSKLWESEADRTIPNPNRAKAGYARGGDDNGRSYMEYVSIPRGAYPDFDAMQAEEIWLYTRIHSLREAKPR